MGDNVEIITKLGLDDLNIAIGFKEKFGIGLSCVWFSTLKNQKDKNGKPTKIATDINEALTRGRARGKEQQQFFFIFYLKGAADPAAEVSNCLFWNTSPDRVAAWEKCPEYARYSTALLSGSGQTRQPTR